MSDEEVDELLKGFPVQYVYVHFFFLILVIDLFTVPSLRFVKISLWQ